MNDNEKLALAEALTANSRRMMELVEANNALVESLVRSLEQSQAVTTINWSNAPEWANWLAMDKNGLWVWFSDEPECYVKSWFHSEDSGIHQHYEDCQLVASDWTKSLQKRPR